MGLGGVVFVKIKDLFEQINKSIIVHTILQSGLFNFIRDILEFRHFFVSDPGGHDVNLCNDI